MLQKIKNYVVTKDGVSWKPYGSIQTWFKYKNYHPYGVCLIPTLLAQLKHFISRKWRN